MNARAAPDGITAELLPAGLLVTVTGELDMANARELEQKLLRNGHLVTRVIVDLTDCSFLDSRGLAVLARAHRALENGACSFSVVARGQPVLTVLQITKLDKVLRIVPDRRAALEG